MRIKLIEGVYAVCKLSIMPPFPSGDFISLTTTNDEISLVCSEENIPPDSIQVQKGFALLKIDEKLDFNLVGVIAKISVALAENGISVFVISTYDTDYILLQKVDLQRAVRNLSKVGYEVK